MRSKWSAETVLLWLATATLEGAWLTLVNITLQWLGLTAKPLPLMYNEFGVVIGLVHIYVPFMVLTLVGVIGRIEVLDYDDGEPDD